MDEELPLPKVTPWLAREADDLCARRLRGDYLGEPSTVDPVNRGRVRDAFIDALRTWSETGVRPDAPAFLEPEERAVVEHALRWYPVLFPELESETIDVVVDGPTELPRRQVRLGGWIDLCITSSDGAHELRLLAFGAPSFPDSPLDLPAARLAILRLAQMRWVDHEPIQVAWADLLYGVVRTAIVRVPDDLEPLGAWLDERLAAIDARIATPDATPGRGCTTCGHVPRCPAHGVRGSMTTRKGDLLPGMLTITPTALEAWHRCPREWRNRVLLSLPPSDPEGGTSHGLYLHSMLRLVHEQGSCHDDRHVADVLARHGGDARAASEVARHAARCPADATSLGNEVEWVRASPEPPVFMASARLDAVWLRDDAVEVRDYKTGARHYEAVRDDPRARLQAWVAAPRAQAEGRPLRVRYEHVAAEIADDPDVWEPDDDDLAQVEAELRATVAEMRAEREFKGVHDQMICRSCRYRSICPDSATPSEPSWPAVVSEPVSQPVA